MFFEQPAAEIFKRKNAGSVDPSAKEQGEFLQQGIDFPDDRSHSVNREHPDRGVPGQRQIFFAERSQRSENNLHTPSRQTADGKVFFKGMFFHIPSLYIEAEKYTAGK